MDFVGELPESEGFNAIMVITDRFGKSLWEGAPLNSPENHRGKVVWGWFTNVVFLKEHM